METLNLTTLQPPLLHLKKIFLRRTHCLLQTQPSFHHRFPRHHLLPKRRRQLPTPPSASPSPPSPSLPDPLPADSESLQYPPGYLGAVPDRGNVKDVDIADKRNIQYLRQIITSKVYDVAIRTPLELATKLSEKLGVNVWLKREDTQPVFSFKIRGAYNMMAKLSKEQLERGVICSSAGNHAQGVALAARRLNCDAVVAMPVTTPDIKWKSVENLGATVVLVGDTYDEAQEYAKRRAEEEGRTFIPPFDHPDVIAGQGTIGMEIVSQISEPVHAIFVPVGGGGLIAGIAAFVKEVKPEIKIIGVEPENDNAMALSLHHGRRVILNKVEGFADGVAVRTVGEETFSMCQELIDGVVLVSREDICASIKDIFEETRNIVEPAGALALVGAKAYCKYYGLQGVNVIAIISGANMNFDRLRGVAELANVGRSQEAILATHMPEVPGSFKRLCELVGAVNITEFKYRRKSEEKAVVLYSVGLHTVTELDDIKKRMTDSNFPTYDLTESVEVQDSLRYMVGGGLKVDDEVFCRFGFPARPGALMKFLDAFSPRWDITLFHYRYRGEGETGANVLVGIQVPSSEMNEFRERADSLKYDYAVVTDDIAFRVLDI